MREYSEQRTILTRDVDFRGKLKCSSILDIFQEIASRGAEGLNLGRDNMLSHNMFWILSRIKIVIDKYAGYKDVVMARTWPKASSPVYFERDYQIIHDNEVIIRASGVWCVLDAQTHALLPSKKLNLFDLDFIKENALDEKLTRIRPHGELIHTAMRNVVLSDLDFNLHVNNTRYADFIVDGMPSTYADKIIKSMQINYLKEAKLNDDITMSYFASDKLLCIVGKSDNCDVFEGQVSFE